MTILGANTASSVAVGATSTQVLAADQQRQHLVITNVSDATIWLSEGATAEASKGVGLAPASGSSPALTPGGEYRTGENGVLFRGAIYAIHEDTGSKNVAIKQS